MSSASRLVITRTLHAPIERVYAAWTNEDMIRQWFWPAPAMRVPEAELDVREGGSYRIVMQNADGDSYQEGWHGCLGQLAGAV